MDSCHKWIGPILGIVIIVFAFKQDLVSAMSSKWIIIIAAVLLILNSLHCHKICGVPAKKKKK